MWHSAAQCFSDEDAHTQLANCTIASITTLFTWVKRRVFARSHLHIQHIRVCVHRRWIKHKQVQWALAYNTKWIDCKLMCYARSVLCCWHFHTRPNYWLEWNADWVERRHRVRVFERAARLIVRMGVFGSAPGRAAHMYYYYNAPRRLNECVKVHLWEIYRIQVINLHEIVFCCLFFPYYIWFCISESIVEHAGMPCPANPQLSPIDRRPSHPLRLIVDPSRVNIS